MRKINPNWLTALRMPLGMMCMGFLCMNSTAGLTLCLVAMAFAVWTDWEDGRVARATGQVSDFGKIFDPLCDSVYLTFIWLGFLHLNWISIWLVVIFPVRDQVVAYMRVYMSHEGVIMAARWSGKIKLTVQVSVQMAVVLLRLIVPASEALDIVQLCLILIAVGVTLYSLYDYFQGFRQTVSVGSFFKTRAAA